MELWTLNEHRKRIGNAGCSHLGSEAVHIRFQFMKDGGIGMRLVRGIDAVFLNLSRRKSLNQTRLRPLKLIGSGKGL